MRELAQAAFLCFSVSPSLWAQLCPFPIPVCRAAIAPGDLNCDHKDDYHCRAQLDVDGATYGDCAPDGVSDDFWTFYDGDFDGVADPCDPADLVLMQADQFPDGKTSNPLCDVYSEDVFQQGGLWFESATTVRVSHMFYPSNPHDLIRGEVANLVQVDGLLDLGPVTCVENDSLDTYTLDQVVPASGRVFFYLGRLGNLGGGEYPYGYSNCVEISNQSGQGSCAE